jgi:hypothetical protein
MYADAYGKERRTPDEINNGERQQGLPRAGFNFDVAIQIWPGFEHVLL